MIHLRDYGYFEENYNFENRNQDNLIPARITELQRERYKLVCVHGEVSAVLLGAFYHETDTRENFPAVGDFVLIRYNPSGESGIAEVLPRKSKFSRTDFSGRGSYAKTVYEQVLATNFDYVFIVQSLNRDFNLRRFSRYLSAAWQSGGMPVLVLSKADLCDDFSEEYESAREIAPFVPIHVISTFTGFGLGELDEYLQAAKTVVFLGSSGVGKSSLLNKLCNRTVMNVGDIRDADSRGRHTTTHRQMTMLPNGALVIDTPGLREMGLWNASEGIGERFANIEELFSRCKFNDCSHTNEPGCAVNAALDDGTLSIYEWEEYLEQIMETEFNMSKAVYLRKKERRFKDIAKSLKKQAKEKRDFN